VLNAYTGNTITRRLGKHESFQDELPLHEFHGWYDLIITVASDPAFNYELAGHVETGEDSFSDPAMGGLVTLKS
jgi:phospholipase C